MNVPDVTVLVVDDQPAFLSAARAVIARSAGFSLIAESASGEDALRVAAAARPDVVLMDIHLPGLDGIETTRRLLAHQRAVVVLLSTYPLADLPSRAGACGAAAYVPKAELSPRRLREVWDGRRRPAG